MPLSTLQQILHFTTSINTTQISIYKDNLCLRGYTQAISVQEAKVALKEKQSINSIQ